MIARAKGSHCLVYHGAEQVILDAPPAARPIASDVEAQSA
jgi:hypothetical protein